MPFRCRFNLKGEEIKDNKKYTVKEYSTSIYLQIESLSVLDTGVYTLEAKNDYMTDKINFTLDVMGIEKMRPLRYSLGSGPEGGMYNRLPWMP